MMREILVPVFQALDLGQPVKKVAHLLPQPAECCDLGGGWRRVVCCPGRGIALTTVQVVQAQNNTPLPDIDGVSKLQVGEGLL